MYCLRVFYKSYIVYYNVYHNYFGVFIQKHVFTKFRLIGSCVSESVSDECVSYMLIYVPTITYGLRLLIVVLQEVQY